MSVGVDVSAVYAEMLQAIESPTTHDVRQTRLVYLYISAVRAPSSDLALLLVNSLHKHARASSPVLRHEAVRCLASIVTEIDYAQFVAPILSKALDDSHPLVRRGATLAALVCAQQQQDPAKKQDLYSALEILVEDLDVTVSLNAVLALCQLHGPSFVPAHSVLMRLFASIDTLHEFARAYMAELVLRIDSCTHEQRLELLNALDSQLDHAESCVVTSAAAAMLHLCRGTPLLKSVCRRLIAPLLALVAHPINDAGKFVAMRHLALVLPEVPEVAVDVDLLFIRLEDAGFVQAEKAHLLSVVANASNAHVCVDMIDDALRVVEASSVVDSMLNALVEIALMPNQNSDVVERVRKQLVACCMSTGAGKRSAAVVHCAALLRQRRELANEATLRAMSEYLLSLSRMALLALLDTIADLGSAMLLTSDCPALLCEVLNLLREDATYVDDSAVTIQLLDATLRCFAGAPTVYSGVAVDVLQFCLNCDDGRVRQRAELMGLVLTQGIEQVRAILKSPSATTIVASQSRTLTTGFNNTSEFAS